MYFGGHWDRFLPIAKFAYNNYYSNIQIVPFEVYIGEGIDTPWDSLMHLR